ncbi:MAG TPA: hypothetical protein VFI19_02685 [Nocardioides sp.]|nr:hypothetical protein [Nocardioides sp.]
MTSACEAMAQVAETIAAEHPEWSGDEFLVELGSRVANIGRGRWAVIGLLLGGRSRIRGGGFRAELRDHSAGQSRHFAGIARAVTLLGANRTRWISVHLRRDAPGSPDGRLTDLAIEFATGMLDGSLPIGRAGDWIRVHVCD